MNNLEWCKGHIVRKNNTDTQKVVRVQLDILCDTSVDVEKEIDKLLENRKDLEVVGQNYEDITTVYKEEYPDLFFTLDDVVGYLIMCDELCYEETGAHCTYDDILGHLTCDEYNELFGNYRPGITDLMLNLLGRVSNNELH